MLLKSVLVGWLCGARKVNGVSGARLQVDCERINPGFSEIPRTVFFYLARCSRRQVLSGWFCGIRERDGFCNRYRNNQKRGVIRGVEPP